MNKLFEKTALTVFILLLGVKIFAQITPSYLVYKNAAAIFNPAYTGAVGENVLSFVFNKQNLGTDQDPITYHLNYTQQFKGKMSAGISFSNTKLNIQNTSTLAVDWAYHLKINEKNDLFFGVKLGAENFNNRLSELAIGSDPVFDGNNINIWNTVLGFGMRLQNDRYFIGVSMPNVLADTEFQKIKGTSQQVRERRHALYLNGGYHFLSGKSFTITPQILMTYQSTLENPFILETVLVGDFNKKWELALGYGTQNKFFTSLGFRFASWGRLAYAYGHFISDFSSINQGTHGFMLQTFF